MMEEMSKDAHEILGNKETFNPNASYFETIIQKAKDTLKVGKIRPEYSKIGKLTEIDNSEFILQLRKSIGQKVHRNDRE